MSRTLLALALAGSLMGLSAVAANAAEDAPLPPRLKWSFSGPFGTYDRGQLQRGFKVYREVCHTCHGLDLLSFRNLGQPGAPDCWASRSDFLQGSRQRRDAFFCSFRVQT